MPTPEGDHLPLAERWRRARAAYRMANLATHHVLGFAVKAVLLAYFLFALLFLVLRYAVLPNIDHYKPDLERLASRALGNQVSIQRVYASWRGLHPSLFLGDVLVRDKQGRPALSLPSVSATLSWWSVPALEPRFDTLEIIRPDLDIRRTRDGALYVAGMRIEATKGEGKGGDWVLNQRLIAIREGRVHWTDELRGAERLDLDDVTLVLRNVWNQHQFALRATPPAVLGQPLDVRARFTHPRFGARISDVSRWKGELYADLRDTDLAAWKRYVDYPFELTSGAGSVRTWIALDQMRLAGFTADVGLAGVSARLGADLPPLALTRVQGRLSAKEELAGGDAAGGTPTFGAHGHSVTLENLAVWTADGTALAPMSMSETWTPAQGRDPERTRFSARMLDLATIAHLAEQLPLSPDQRRMLDDFAPRGRLVDFAAQWDGRYPKLGHYRVRGKVAGLSLAAQPARLAQPASGATPAVSPAPAIPGFDNLSGSIDATDEGGAFTLDSDHLVLQLPGYFATPALPLDRLKMAARWSFEKNNQLLFQVDEMAFAQGALSGTLKGRHLMPLAAGKGPGTADFTATLDGFDIGRTGSWLPVQTPPHLRDWLAGALEAGTLNAATLRLRGELAAFPFRAGTPDAAKGEFHAEGRIADARLNYLPEEHGKDGKSPLWPQAEHINGSIVFDRARLEVHGDTARTLGVNLANIKAVVPDLRADDLLLDIDGSAAGPLNEYLKYVAASPVLEWIGNFTEDAHAGGNARLGLKLHIPLHHGHDTKVSGALQLLGSEVVLFPELPAVQNANGRIEFTERGVNLAGVGGTFVGGPLAVTGGTQRDGAIVVRLAGSVTAEGLRRAYAAPVMQRLAGHFTGGTRFTGSVVVREHQAQVTVDSSMAGVGMDFPAPLRKPAAEALPVHFQLTSLPSAEADVARDELRLSVGSMMAARYLRQKNGKGPWTVVRGGIGVNNPAPEPESGLTLNVALKSLDVDKWTALGGSLAGPAGAPARARGAEAEPDLAQYVVPDVTAARANELTIADRKLEDVVVGASHTKGTWQASINARQIEGWLTWNESPTGQGLGKVTARLAALDIPESAAGEVKEIFEGGKGSVAQIPALDVVAERFQLFNKPLGRLEVQAQNTMGAGGREWRISKLALDNPDGQLDATGRWSQRDGKSSTTLNFKLGIADAGKLLDRLGFPDTLRHGKGKMEGEVAWNGLPYALDPPSLSGKIDLDVGAGQFLKKDPGAAKLLGVLSLQMLPRLLKLDFHDVFSEGLAFDGITANATIQRGVLTTNNLKMHGVAATVLMDGSTDIANETANLHVVVIPEFNLGTGPLVYALAVNPVVGIGSFLAQLFLRAPVMKALTYQMQVTGPWKAPVITKLDHQGRPAGAEPAPAAK
ncbi:MAG: YhdP family protein [Telluria sp.]